jgi:hypothetical protein
MDYGISYLVFNTSYYGKAKGLAHTASLLVIFISSVTHKSVVAIVLANIDEIAKSIIEYSSLSALLLLDN